MTNICLEGTTDTDTFEIKGETDHDGDDNNRPFPCKSKLCVFCVDLITEDFEDITEGHSLLSSNSKVSPGVFVDTFLQGISVLCETINASNASKFSSRSLWSLDDVRENFVQLVCCQTCYSLLAKMVSLRQLILTTQATLKEHVQKIENFIVESQRKAVLEDREYSVNACVSFREEILKHISKGDDVNSSQDTTKKSLPQSKKSRPGSKRSQKSSKASSPLPALRRTQELQTPYVKLERLDNLSGVIPPSDSVLVSDASNVASPLGSECSDFDPMNATDDDEYQPISRRKRGTGRKPGRPKKRKTDDGDKQVTITRRKRGRHPKTQAVKDFPIKLRTTKQSNSKLSKTETHHDICKKSTLHDGEKRKRNKTTGIYLDSKPLDDDDKEDVNSDDCGLLPGTQEEDDDYQPEQEEPHSEENSEEDDEYKPHSRPLSSRKSRKSVKRLSKKQDSVSEDTDEVYTFPIKKPARGRPAQVGSRRYRYLHEEGPKHKPIYQLDETSKGHLMFHSVKFYKTPYFLQCLHPDCSHLEHFTGYFADQVTFRNFRFHVRKQHRAKYKCVGDESKNLYYCHQCEAQIDTRDGLLEHRRTLHPDAQMPPVLCEICGVVMPQVQIVNHTISHKNKEEKEVAIAERSRLKGKPKDITRPICYPCDECSKVFKCHTDLRTHKQSHIPLDIRRRWICEFCGEKYSSQGSLEQHKRRVHLKTLPSPFKCSICSRTYLSCEKHKFEDHMRSHTGDKPFICPQCGKGFHSKWNMTKHERLHSSISVTCEFCSNVYKSYRYLRRHHLKHHPDLVERPSPEETAKCKGGEHREDIYGPKLMFPCEPCNHVYVYKSMLITHLKGKHNMQLASKEDYPAMWTYEDHYAEDLKKV